MFISFSLDLLQYGRHWSLSRWRRDTDLRAMDQGPHGVVAARRLPMRREPSNHALPQPLLHSVRRQRASLALHG